MYDVRQFFRLPKCLQTHGSTNDSLIERRLNVPPQCLSLAMTNHNMIIQVTAKSLLALGARRMAGNVLTPPRGANQARRRVPCQSKIRACSQVLMAVGDRYPSIFRMADTFTQVKIWLQIVGLRLPSLLRPPKSWRPTHRCTERCPRCPTM